MGVTETATSPELREIIARKIPANNVRASLEGIKNREEIVRHFGLATLLDGKINSKYNYFRADWQLD